MMRKFAPTKLCLLISIGLIQQGICSSPPETKENLTIFQKGLKKLKEIKKGKETENALKDLEPENVLKALIKAKALPKTSQISMVFNTAATANTEATALAAKQIIFIRDQDNSSFVIKRFNTLEGFQEEEQGLNNVNKTIIPLIKSLKDTSTCKLPVITSGKAYPKIDKVGVVVLEGGRGDTFYDRFIKNLSKISENSITVAFTAIGEQFGCLDKEFYKKYNTILLHGDAHARNFTYYDPLKTVYWIDTSGMALSNKASAFSTPGKRSKPRVTGMDKLEFLYQIAGSKERFDQLEEWLKKAKIYQNEEKVVDISSLSPATKKELEADLKNIQNARKKDFLAIEAYKKGYLSMNPDQEKDFNVDIDWYLSSASETEEITNRIEQYSKMVTGESLIP